MFSVFPRGRAFSLRGTLLLWLLPTFLCAAVITAGLSYRMFTHMVVDFLDDQMVQTGDSIARSERMTGPREQMAQRVNERGLYVIQVFDADGRLTASTWDGVRAQRMPHPGLHAIEEGARTWRVYATQGAGGETVQVLQSGSFRAQLAVERAGGAALPVLLLLPLSIAVLFGVARAISSDLRAVARQAARQDANTIAELPLDRVPDEIRPLVSSFNTLLARLRDAFAAQRRFVQDAAHELRTPIAAVRLQLENLRDALGTGTAAPQLLQLESGMERAQRVVDQLLRMSRQEAGATEARASIELETELRESINALFSLADQRRVDLGLVKVQCSDTLALQCPASELRSALDNLIENAVRYTPEGGVVDVRLFTDDGRPVVEVVDTGPGIPQEFLGRVLDRFFRVPGSAAGGSGLGLSIAHAAAQRCGLVLSLRNRTDRSGLIARLETARD